MATLKQIHSNRNNSLKSSGPKTITGKETVKLNAISHGILAKQSLLPGEDGRHLNLIKQRLQSELKPETQLEGLFTDLIAANIWRLRRILTIESHAMAYEYQQAINSDNQWANLLGETSDGIKETKAMTSMIEHPRFEILLRYEAHIKRTIFHSLHELQRLQTFRMGERQPLPAVIDVNLS